MIGNPRTVQVSTETNKRPATESLAGLEHLINITNHPPFYDQLSGFPPEHK